ncbi:MAG: hypothetical protein AB9856_20720 [Cellulosilyticaceae bacterium]
MIEDTSLWIWAWIVLCSLIIAYRGHKKIKENEVKKRKHHNGCNHK